MKPIMLTMVAFGPYRDQERIDFRQLQDRRLFVISGNTGAGKTSIFDAICYALYGSASGEDRSDPRMLRSHFAADDQYTAVEFEFTAGSRKYRVLRQLAHRKAGNKNETGGKAELYETTSGQSVPCLDRFTIPEVNARLESIIGLSKDQFSQIVMLPQGEFRKLLTSDTENKEEILRRLFRTELYQRLEERFQQASRELKDKVKDARLELEVLVKQTRQAQPQREGSKLSTALSQQYWSAAQLLEALEEEQLHYAELAQEASEQKAGLEQQLSEHQEAVRQAMLLNGRFDELQQKREQLHELLQRQPEMSRLEQQLQLAERAGQLLPYEEQEQQAGRQELSKRRAAEQKRADVQQALSAWQEAQAAYQLVEAQEQQRKAAAQELQQLEQLSEAVQALAQRHEEVRRLQAVERQCRSKLEQTEQSLATSRQARRELAEAMKQLETASMQLPHKLEQLEQLRSKFQLLKALSELEQRLHSYSLLEKERWAKAEQSRQEHDRLERQWIEGQAAVLAIHLHEGLPCPVCGSEQHPHKAAADEELPSREALQQAKEQLRAAEQELSEARAQAAAAATDRQEKHAGLAQLGIAEATLAEEIAAAEAEGKQLRSETDQLKQQSKQLAEARERLDKLDRQLEQLLQEKDAAVTKLQQVSVQYSTANAVLEKELLRIPEPLRTPGELQQRIQQTRERERDLIAAWKQAQEQLQHRQTRLAEERANSMQMEAQLVEASQQAEQSRIRWAQELAKAGFANARLYQEAKRPEPLCQEWRNQLQSYGRELEVLNQQVSELQLQLAGSARIELDPMRQQSQQLKQALEAASAAQFANQSHSESAARLLQAIAKVFSASRELEDELAEVMDIYQMLKGDNALKISFERYILIEFLEQILQAANARLHNLSDGQFMLQRSERLETRGKQSGLGLDVYDAYTGQNRDVKTLSGGEKFNASLCLALGMTDVIQANQGGVSIEMMFIDEGFGSLDEESLHKAIAALVDLQKAGRLIGVISHVQELKQAFPAVLEVYKAKQGFSRTSLLLK